MNPKTRWYQHCRSSKRLIDAKIQQYGKENFTFEVIETHQGQQDANDAEIRLIQEHKSHVSTGQGYNVDYGGKSSLKCDATKKKMSLASRGNLKALGHKKTKHRFMGVRPHYNKWKAEIKVKGKHIFIGCFDTEEAAAVARDDKVFELYGDKAKFNFERINL